MMVCVRLPLRIVSEANSSDHWRKVAARKKTHRSTARLVLKKHARPVTDGQIKISLIRLAPRVLDGDNLQSGFKATRDGVADWLGIDDGSARLKWAYHQERGAAKEYAAIVQIEWNV